MGLLYISKSKRRHPHLRYRGLPLPLGCLTHSLDRPTHHHVLCHPYFAFFNLKFQEAYKAEKTVAVIYLFKHGEKRGGEIFKFFLCIPGFEPGLQKVQRVSKDVMADSLYSLDWTTGLDYWTGLLDWTTGLDYWTGLLDWTTGLDYWTGLLDWTTGLDYWTGLLDWTTGLDYWTGLLDWTTGLDYWTGLLDWTTGLDYWTGLLDWTTGLALHNNVGYQNKGGVNKMQPNKCSMLP